MGFSLNGGMKMDEQKIIIGGILLAVAIYVFTSMISPAKELGGAILGISGLVYLIDGLFGR